MEMAFALLLVLIGGFGLLVGLNFSHKEGDGDMSTLYAIIGGAWAAGLCTFAAKVMHLT
jgi:hypothetical protein